MALIAKFKLDLIPPMLLGVAESYVLAKPNSTPGSVFVCRRLRLAVALPETRLDEDNQPYDYETHVIYLAHFYDCEQEPPFIDLLTDLTECRSAPDGLPAAKRTSVHRRRRRCGRLSAIHLWKLNVQRL